MLNINNLSMHFGGRYLFDGVNLSISKNDKIGLIGRNGTGKSTLLKILIGDIQPEEGKIITPNEYTLGYLPQDLDVVSDKTVYDEAYSALTEIITLNEKIDNFNDTISHRTDYESEEYFKLIEDFNHANDRLTLLGGNSVDAEIEKILKGLGFKSEDLSRPLEEFSGGWKMRVELAKLLLQKPDAILLDEPTNHLDIESIMWLEVFLRNYPGSVILVSHDRQFLDNLTNRTIELFAGKAYDMPCKYSEFMVKREEIKEQQFAAFKNQQKQIAQTERFIERFRSKSTLATRVQSRVKALDKVERIELEEDDNSAINIKFPEPPRSGRMVVEIEGLSKWYGDLEVLRKIDFDLERGDKVAFVGKNGEGKSTLSRIIAGKEIYDGKMTIGHNVQISYFSQHQADLMEPNITVFDVIDNAATGDMRSRVRSLLGAFLFSGDDVYKKVKVLSGGERSRLALARLMLTPMNLLILDEPTNHLDMRAKDILKEALKKYEGSLLIVSHDRDFLSGLTEKTLHFRDKGIQVYPGDINYFLEKQQIENLDLLNKKDQSENQTNSESKNQLDRVKRKELQRDESKLKKQLASLESDIEKCEEKINKYETMFADPNFFTEVANAKEIQTDYDKQKSSQNKLMTTWEEVTLKLDEISEKLN